MNTTADPITRTMLALSAISYRGSNIVGPQAAKRALLRSLLDESLTQLQPLIGEWSIVWGPCDFSPTVVGFDDAMMFVTEKVQDPTTLAIVIRGTNPISISDFIFEDSMVEVQQAWPAFTGALISASTALGLAVLLDLRWDETVLSSATSGMSERPAANLQEIALERTERNSSRTGVRVVDMLTAHSGAAEQPSDGITLEAFLRARLTPRSAANLYVTGHSKGGALSSTMALRLAEILSDCVVHNYSFAGPTGGNAVFAAYSDRILAARCHRIWNLRDVVPRSFVPSLLEEIPDRYELTDVERAAVTTAIGIVTASVSGLGYTQVAGDGTSFQADLAPDLDLTSQIAHQHVDAYLGWADLLGEMSAASLFAPVL
jgi:triacylglycerol lipase